MYIPIHFLEHQILSKKVKKLDRIVILDTSYGSIYAIGEENESWKKIHWIN